MLVGLCRFFVVLMVIFIVKRVPVFRIYYNHISRLRFLQKHREIRQIPFHLLKVETGFNQRADLEFVRTPYSHTL